MRAQFSKSVLWVGTIVLAFGLVTAVGQQSPPRENKGITTPKTIAMDLGPEIDGMQGRQLRLRVIKADPGGVIGLHSHKDRPTVLYVIQGNLTEYYEGGAVKEYREGDAWTKGKDATHWAENKGATPVVFVGADVLKP